MEAPEKIFPPRKEAQFDETGRPHHTLFYTCKPNFYQVLHVSRKNDFFNTCTKSALFRASKMCGKPGFVGRREIISGACADWLQFYIISLFRYINLSFRYITSLDARLFYSLAEQAMRHLTAESLSEIEHSCTVYCLLGFATAENLLELEVKTENLWQDCCHNEWRQ